MKENPFSTKSDKDEKFPMANRISEVVGEVGRILVEDFYSSNKNRCASCGKDFRDTKQVETSLLTMQDDGQHTALKVNYTTCRHCGHMQFYKA